VEEVVAALRVFCSHSSALECGNCTTHSTNRSELNVAKRGVGAGVVGSSGEHVAGGRTIASGSSLDDGRSNSNRSGNWFSIAVDAGAGGIPFGEELAGIRVIA